MHSKNVLPLGLPQGAGSLQFAKPYRSSFDGFNKSQNNPLNYLAIEYPYIENRLILFSSDLVRQRMSNNGINLGPRIAIAFDLYYMVHMDMQGGGLPHFELLRRLI